MHDTPRHPVPDGGPYHGNIERATVTRPATARLLQAHPLYLEYGHDIPDSEMQMHIMRCGSLGSVLRSRLLFGSSNDALNYTSAHRAVTGLMGHV